MERNEKTQNQINTMKNNLLTKSCNNLIQKITYNYMKWKKDNNEFEVAAFLF